MSASSDENALFAEPENRPRLTSEQELRLFQAVGRYVEAVVRRRSTKSFSETVPEIAELPLYGAFVSLKRRGQLRSCCGYIDEQAILSLAVSHAAERAAKDDPRFPPITPEELNSLDMEVWILWGPEEIQAKGEARVGEVEIGKHGLICQRGSARGLLLPGVATEHHFDSREFLRQTCRKAGLSLDAWLDDATQVMRFEGYAIHGAFPPSFEDARPAAVAGMFYPADPDAVRRDLDRLLSGPSDPQPCAAALIPHAGWKYSGRVAGAVFNRVEIPQSVIILCPKHRSGGSTWAAAPFRRWLIPGGEIAGDVELTAKLAHAIDGLELDAAPHEQEHAVEVMLPFLARIAPQTRIVGVTVGGCSLSDAQHFAYGLSEVMRSEKERPLIIVSSDMNHFASDVENRIQDRVALDAIETLNPSHVYETVHLHRISMCGVYPCVIAMEALRLLGSLNKCELVEYATSGDVTGERDRVVGYAGMIFK